jgi:hypothetical protein
MILCAMLHAALHTVSFVQGEMHSDWFNRIEILQGRWQHGEKLGYCYPSGLEKALCKWNIYVPLVTKRLIHKHIKCDKFLRLKIALISIVIILSCHFSQCNFFSPCNVRVNFV